MDLYLHGAILLNGGLINFYCIDGVRDEVEMKLFLDEPVPSRAEGAN
jgi:hypothetical protein